MIRHDHFHSQLFDMIHFGGGNTAAVHRYDQLRAFVEDAVCRTVIQPVSLGKAGGYVIHQLLRKIRKKFI